MGSYIIMFMLSNNYYTEIRWGLNIGNDQKCRKIG
uniref:Uncharacterized protein n=1 Tax=Anguilla anguilla TaxID=7936 RepID=A0A0E9V5T7_ANGAN